MKSDIFVVLGIIFIILGLYIILITPLELKYLDTFIHIPWFSIGYKLPGNYTERASIYVNSTGAYFILNKGNNYTNVLEVSARPVKNTKYVIVSRALIINFFSEAPNIDGTIIIEVYQFIKNWSLVAMRKIPLKHLSVSGEHYFITETYPVKGSVSLSDGTLNIAWFSGVSLSSNSTISRVVVKSDPVPGIIIGSIKIEIEDTYTYNYTLNYPQQEIRPYSGVENVPIRLPVDVDDFLFRVGIILIGLGNILALMGIYVLVRKRL